MTNPKSTRDDPVVPWLVLSPHFDDAVLSCGHLLSRNPGAVVVTVCAGLPGDGIPPSPWDARSGFSSGNEAAVQRRSEDSRALEILGSRQSVLGFVDGGYLSYGHVHEDPRIAGPREEALANAIVQLIDDLQPNRFLYPLGLVHGDHISVSAAATSAIASRPACKAFAYFDLPYAITWPELVTPRLQALDRHTAFFPTRPESDIGLDAKTRAVGCYRSQLDQLSDAHPKWRMSLQRS